MDRHHIGRERAELTLGEIVSDLRWQAGVDEPRSSRLCDGRSSSLSDNKTGGEILPRIDLLHLLGDAPEGPWAIFSLPHDDGTDLVSVIVPRSLWLSLTRAHPFDSEISLMETVGRAAVQRALQAGKVAEPLFVMAEDVLDRQEEGKAHALPWFRALRVCGQCGQDVPPGEVSEGLSNALPPDSRGYIELKVLCPTCQVQTPHRLTPWGIAGT
jgi:hypothetical protein